MKILFFTMLLKTTFEMFTFDPPKYLDSLISTRKEAEIENRSIFTITKGDYRHKKYTPWSNQYIHRSA